MNNSLSIALEKVTVRIANGYQIDCESDFKSVLFGELYKELPNAIIKFEKKLCGDYQSYTENGKARGKRKSRVDLHVEHESKIVVIEVKYLQGAGASVKADMIADIAKVERIIEAEEASEGYCIQLVKPRIVKRLPIGPVEIGHHHPIISGWNYDFEIKGQYQIKPSIHEDGYATIVHHVGQEST
jgi:hypothetical protein